MADANSRMNRDISKYIQHMNDVNLCKDYVRETRRMLLHFREYCMGIGINATGRIRSEHVQDYHATYERYSGAYRRKVYAVLRGFLGYYDNASALKFKLRIRGYKPSHVDWLTPAETESILAMPMTTREAILIRAGLLQGLRRVETVRMSVEDARKGLSLGEITIRGKGGKYRQVPLHIGLSQAVKAHLDRNPQLCGSDSLISIGRERASALVVGVSLRFGRRFTTHTLRRTFGRNLWLRGIPIETISELMGHTSTDMTRLYLGLNVTDMRKAICEYGSKSELRIIENAPQRRIGSIVAAPIT